MLYRVLPMRHIVLGLGELLDVPGGVVKGDELAPVRKLYGIGEGR